MNTNTTTADYTVKGVKTFTGMEGQGFNATLYRDGKAVAFVIDDASGGEMDIQWKDTAAERINVETVAWDGKPWWVTMTPEQKRLYEVCAAMPEQVCSFNDADGKPARLAMTMTLFVDNLINDYLQLRDVARRTKKQIVMVREGNMYTFTGTPSEKNIAGVKSKYPDAIILNGLSDADTLSALRSTEK